MSDRLSVEVKYDNKTVAYFMMASLIWGGAAFLFGLLAAVQLAWWPANMNLEWFTFGRLRPLHTNAAVFAFAGNAVFAGVYHSSQRLLKARMFSDLLSKIHFWGWQLIILSAAITLPLGFSQSKEYAELEWPIDIAITLIWVVFAINFFGTLAKRKEKHIYVALWFYIATILTVAVLHIVNSLEIPVSFLQSYPVFAGVQDALVQWWYGHNAVAFFLTTPFLGLMYYYIPKVVNKPIYSYRLSIVHFWSLVFIYIWAGPHHLLYTALPDWAQTLGMVFSLMLWAPSWGGMINGLLTLRGSWHLLRTEPIVKFFVAAITFYGMATFEGPLLSIKSVSLLAHYTDWIIGHVHAAALGWNGFMIFGMVYYLIPKIWGQKMYSTKLMNYHFWLGLSGILLYYISMITSGLTQGLMWKAVDSSGFLVYPDFVETVIKVVPLYWVRAFGGLLFIFGYFVGVYNIIKTINLASPFKANESVQIVVKQEPHQSTTPGFHRKLEGLVGVFSVLTLVAVLIGTVIEIWPTLFIHKYVPQSDAIYPYTALEQAGRDIYVKEGCYTCHSQMIRKHPSDVLRFGEASTISESMYDHPFQWGSKRTGPDLARIGSKYPNLWHFRHMDDPRLMVEKSIMPRYSWLLEKKVDFYSLRKKLSVLKFLGVPYTDEQVSQADRWAENQAEMISLDLKNEGITEEMKNTQIVALIAYLQSLGQKGKENKKAIETLNLVPSKMNQPNSATLNGGQ